VTTTGTIGGRAMLQPGESVSAALKRIHGPDEAPPAEADQRPGRHATRNPPDAGVPRAPAQRGAHDLEFADWTQPPRPPEAGRHGARAKNQAAGRVVGRLRRSRRLGLAALAVGAVGLLVLVIAAVSSQVSGIGDPGTGARPSNVVTSPADKPLLDVQEYHDDRGIIVNVPKTWTRSAASSYVDFTDPVDKSRKVRINVEPAANARRFLEVAENGLKSNKTSCPVPYTRVALNDAVTLDGKPAAELEYTCGQGDQARHGVWRAVVVGGKSYHFFMTVPEAQFTDSKVVYDEMVRSFHLAVASTGPSNGT
jgi:hypothetical protein